MFVCTMTEDNYIKSHDNHDLIRQTISMCELKYIGGFITVLNV